MANPKGNPDVPAFKEQQKKKKVYLARKHQG